MSVSFNLNILRADDEDYRNKIKAAKAVIEAGFELPEEMQDFFGTDEPKFGDGLCLKTVYVDMDSDDKEEYIMRDSTSYSNKVIIDLEKLPDGVRYIEALVSC